MTNPQPPFILALTGKPGAGKDTIADLIAPALGFARLAFADALRSEISEAWRIDTRMLTSRETKEWPIPALAVGMCNATGFISWMHDQGESLTEPRSARWVMQNYGDYQRRHTPDYYAAKATKAIQRLIGTGHRRIVITDLRYRIEEEALRAIPGASAYTVRVVRLSKESALSADTERHSSELDQDNLTPHAVIFNNATKTDLAKQVLFCLKRFSVDVETPTTVLPLPTEQTATDWSAA